jgi:1,4-dihydroxy-6-naphthoate synthase
MADEKTITIGFSPCPNDTFIFNGLVNGLVDLPGLDLHEELHDVETLNRMAFRNTLDITKLSFFAWLMVKDQYQLLNSGGAMGYGCGPVVIAKKQLSLRDMPHCRIVLPGQWTTAHLLFRMWAPRAGDRYFEPYDRIFDALSSGRADCGVIIHESRFTYQQLGYHAVADLGAWWQDVTGMPIPLGGIGAHRRMGKQAPQQVDNAICKSIQLARENPQATLPYIRRHAQEMTAEVLDAHIHTFVNEFSLDLGELGRKAVKMLEDNARQRGIIP